MTNRELATVAIIASQVVLDVLRDLSQSIHESGSAGTYPVVKAIDDRIWGLTASLEEAVDEKHWLHPTLVAAGTVDDLIQLGED